MNASASALSLAQIRAAFPALTQDIVFFDNAGGSQVLRSVADRVADYMLTTSVQHGASYATSQLAKQRLEQARGELASLVNASDPTEILIGGSATALLQNLSRAIGTWFAPGDELIVSEAEHEANIGPWRRLAEARGLVLKRWPVSRDTGLLDVATLQRLLTDRTRLVAFTHASNLVGAIHPVAEICKLVRDAGALSVVDGVAYASHRAVDVQQLGCDFYVVSLYKIFGPHQGLLWGKRAHLVRADSLNHRFVAADDLPYKLQPGHQNYELSWGAGAIVAYLQALGGGTGRAGIEAGYARIAEREAALTERLLAFLRGQQRVRIVGPADADAAKRVATIAFTVDGKAPRDIVAATDAAGIGLRHGDFYSRDLSEALGLAPHGVIRASIAHYNTEEEVDRLIAVLQQVI
ncbi:cysteine desulfurase-like protein [Roseiterribacter gracilis]|uniref:Cysteine desulfurase-like protein n=1 Tax=Roseiterribacter gracilis TaxID=2812848 RepID=A0A8S8X5M6_9PROT|nr:cysteine desulfurase-like protein [Rhodospirillales bacterium TMPK1]